MIKVALFGYGHLGKIHFKCLQQTSFDLIGYYDPKVNDQSVTSETSVPSYQDSDLLMSECEACIIASTTSSHAGLIRNAISMGKHFFVEKPMTSTVEEAQEIDDLLSKKPEIISQVGFVERYNPAYTFIKSSIVEPRFIEVHRLSGFSERGNDVSVVLDLMIHDLDLVLSMVQSEVKEIKANGLKLVSDSLDMCNARIEFKNKAVANLTASRMSLKQMRKFRVFQKDAYLSLDLDDKKAQVVSLSDEAQEEAMKVNLGGGDKYLSVSNSEKFEGNAIVDELNDFYNSILNNKQPLTNCRAALRTSIVADQIEKIALESSII
ncbi:Gfo/Idh/MocA family oxidoreductase [Saprospiraceae bacterium]|nr:Gfo/Idh/MocA family oxidoreductase [Saprospiraceae bacterium]